jgi:hypothetical protein
MISGALPIIIAIVDWRSSAKILLSSAIAAASTYTLISELSFSNWIRLIIGVVFFAFVYVAAACLKTRVPMKPIIMKSTLPIRKLFNAVLKPQLTFPASGYKDDRWTMITPAATAESARTRSPKTIVNLAYFIAV